jgi:hypothetical protein
MKRQDLVFLAALTALSALYLAPKKHDALNIHGVEPGMTREQVNQRLGTPTITGENASYGTPWLATVVFEKDRAVRIRGQQLSRGPRPLADRAQNKESMAEQLGPPLATRSHPSWRGDCPETQCDYAEGLTVTYRYGKNLDGRRYGNALFELTTSSSGSPPRHPPP